MASGSRSGPTINDVAQLAGVSIGTVSRVINGSPNVGESYRARVEAAVRELDYRPNVLAQRFVKHSSKMISFILANRAFYHPIHPRILQGASDYCEQAGYFVLFSRFSYSADADPNDLELPRVLRSHNASDAVILAGLNYGNLLAALENTRTPCVTFRNSLAAGVEIAPYDVVRVDDFTASVDAVRHLISLGHRDILFIGDTGQPWYETRYLGYLEAVRGAGLRPLSQTRPLSADLFGDGQQSAAQALDSGKRFTALFAGIDAIGYGAMATLRERGLDVPRDVSIVGFGDQYGNARLPALTTVQMDTEEVGRQLARLAIEKTNDPKRPLPEVVIACKFIKRGTCAAVPSRAA